MCSLMERKGVTDINMLLIIGFNPDLIGTVGRHKYLAVESMAHNPHSFPAR